jgi:hypothetical protein
MTAHAKVGRRVVARSKRVTFSGSRTIRLRVTRKAARRPRRMKGAKLTVSAVARDGLKNVRARSVKVKLRR